MISISNITPLYELPIDILRNVPQNVTVDLEAQSMPLQIAGEDLEDALFKLGRLINQRKEAGQNAVKTIIETGRDTATANMMKTDISAESKQYWRGQYDAYNNLLTNFNNALKNSGL